MSRAKVIHLKKLSKQFILTCLIRRRKTLTFPAVIFNSYIFVSLNWSPVNSIHPSDAKTTLPQVVFFSTLTGVWSCCTFRHIKNPKKLSDTTFVKNGTDEWDKFSQGFGFQNLLSLRLIFPEIGNMQVNSDKDNTWLQQYFIRKCEMVS